MTIYTVIANRWGDDESHSYLVGVYDDIVRAYRAAIAEERWRSGKYECKVHESELNAENVCGVDGESKEVWCRQMLADGAYEKEVMARVNVYNVKTVLKRERNHESEKI